MRLLRENASIVSAAVAVVNLIWATPADKTPGTITPNSGVVIAGNNYGSVVVGSDLQKVAEVCKEVLGPIEEKLALLTRREIAVAEKHGGEKESVRLAQLEDATLRTSSAGMAQHDSKPVDVVQAVSRKDDGIVRSRQKAEIGITAAIPSQPQFGSPSGLLPNVAVASLSQPLLGSPNGSLPNVTVTSLSQPLLGSPGGLLPNVTVTSLSQPLLSSSNGLLPNVTVASLSQPLLGSPNGLSLNVTVTSLSQPLLGSPSGLLPNATVASLSQPQLTPSSSLLPNASTLVTQPLSQMPSGAVPSPIALQGSPGNYIIQGPFGKK